MVCRPQRSCGEAVTVAICRLPERRENETADSHAELVEQALQLIARAVPPHHPLYHSSSLLESSR